MLLFFPCFSFFVVVVSFVLCCIILYLYSRGIHQVWASGLPAKVSTFCLGTKILLKISICWSSCTCKRFSRSLSLHAHMLRSISRENVGTNNKREASFSLEISWEIWETYSEGAMTSRKKGCEQDVISTTLEDYERYQTSRNKGWEQDMRVTNNNISTGWDKANMPGDSWKALNSDNNI